MAREIVIEAGSSGRSVWPWTQRDPREPICKEQLLTILIRHKDTSKAPKFFIFYACLTNLGGESEWGTQELLGSSHWARHWVCGHSMCSFAVNKRSLRVKKCRPVPKWMYVHVWHVMCLVYSWLRHLLLTLFYSLCHWLWFGKWFVYNHACVAAGFHNHKKAGWQVILSIHLRIRHRVNQSCRVFQGEWVWVHSTH